MPWPELAADGRLELAALGLDRYEAAVRLLHPIWEDLSLAGDDSPWPDPWDRRFGRGRPATSFPARGLKWHDLAEERGIDFGPGTELADLAATFPGGRWPRRLVGPEDGELEAMCLHHLARLLRSFLPPGRECPHRILSHPGLAWTLVAGPRDLIDALLADKPLDAVDLAGLSRIG